MTTKEIQQIVVPDPCPRLLGLLELRGLVGHSDDSSDLYQFWIAPHVYRKLTCKSRGGGWTQAVVLEIGSPSKQQKDLFRFSRYAEWESGSV